MRELLGFGEREVVLPDGATAREAILRLQEEAPALAAFAASTRLARNGTFVSDTEMLHDGDELALLPPVGGG